MVSTTIMLDGLKKSISYLEAIVSPGATGSTLVLSLQATASQLPSYAIKSVLIKADPNNTSSVLVGFGSGLSTGGFPLMPGDTIVISIDDLSKLWMSSGSGTQVAYLIWVG